MPSKVVDPHKNTAHGKHQQKIAAWKTRSRVLKRSLTIFWQHINNIHKYNLEHILPTLNRKHQTVYGHNGTRYYVMFWWSVFVNVMPRDMEIAGSNFYSVWFSSVIFSYRYDLSARGALVVQYQSENTRIVSNLKASFKFRN